MTDTRLESDGYREQSADLQRDDTTSPRARYILEQHQAILRDTPFNRGVLAATADYIRAQEGRVVPAGDEGSDDD